MFLREIKEDPNKWRAILCSWMERFYVGLETCMSWGGQFFNAITNASSLCFLNGESHSYFKIYMEIKLAKNSQ